MPGNKSDIGLKVFYLTGMILILLIPSCSEKFEDEVVYDTSRSFVFRDVKYGSEPRQSMNIFLPADRGRDSTRLIILIHGGGWISGDKNDFDTFAGIFSTNKVAAVTVNYRYADPVKKVGYEEILNDIGNAIKCISDSSRKYSIDVSDITLMGHSAGGHIALMFAYTRNSVNNIRNVISLAGPTDLDDPIFLSISGITDLVNNLTGYDIDRRKEASPVNHVSIVTTYLYHGKTDAIVPWQQSDKLYGLIRSLNSKNRLSLIENCGHGFGFSEFSGILEETIELINKIGDK
ncbi:MAG: alpha/beta hydrolase [Bacteroidales bacterium]